MKKTLLVITLVLVSNGAWAEFTCPNGLQAACLDSGDKVCPATAKCVAQNATCFDDYACGPDGGYVCASKYEAALQVQQHAVKKYDALAAENIHLREQRLERKNCVLNAARLEDAKRCVR